VFQQLCLTRPSKISAALITLEPLVATSLSIMRSVPDLPMIIGRMKAKVNQNQVGIYLGGEGKEKSLDRTFGGRYHLSIPQRR